MQTVTISTKFQITVPKRVREELHLKVGQQFIFVVKENSIQLVPKRTIADVKGILAGANTHGYQDREDRL